MANYRYKAKNAQGETVSGTVSAQNETDAVADIRRQGLVVFSLDHKRGGESEPTSPAGKAHSEGAGGGLFSFSMGKKKIKLQGVRVKTSEMVVFTRQLSTMISAGIRL